MARLNDLPTAAESVESLKRRFVRQNREIARANSVQSLRIRSLESEVSRLLAENVSLREEVVSLSTELERFQAGRQLDNDINVMKGKLDAKLAELGGLITDLGMLPRRRQMVDDGDERSPTLTTKPVRDNTVVDERRLPVILEDKSYPRLTLEVQDVGDLSRDIDRGACTPDTPPAPEIQSTVLDFASPSSEEDAFEFSRATYIEPKQASHPLPNLETRKKRRDSALLRDINLENTVSTKQETESPPKSGSKRKLGARDDDGPNLGHAKHFDDFQYTRVGETSQQLELEDDQYRPAHKPMQKSKPQSQRESATGRRILGPKSTNSNLKSPTKMRIAERAQELHKAEKPPVKDRTNKVFSTRTPDTGRQKRPDIAEIHLPDTSPATDKKESISESPADCEADVLPLSKNHEDPQKEPKDIPPFLSTSSSRPSRRSRGAVSYAEPNLRDKMRRPTKEFVNAVEADRFRRASKPNSEQELAGDADENATQDGTSTKAHDEAMIPLQDKPENWPVQLPSNVMTDRKRRTLSASKFDLSTTDDPPPSMSSRAISTLVAGTKTRPQSKERRNKDTEKLYENSTENVSLNSTLLDETDSAELDTSTDNVCSAGGSRSTGSKSRRTRSSGPVNIGRRSDANIGEAPDPPVREGPTKQRAARSSYAENKEVMSGLDHDTGNRSQFGVGEVKRVQRLGARRRSMML